MSINCISPIMNNTLKSEEDHAGTLGGFKVEEA